MRVVKFLFTLKKPGTWYIKHLCVLRSLNQYVIYKPFKFKINKILQQSKPNIRNKSLFSLSEQFSYQEFEFMDDDDFQELVSPKLYETDCDSIMFDLKNVVKIEDIFKIVNLNKRSLSKNHAIQAIISISSLKTIAEQNKMSLKCYGQSLIQNDMTEFNSMLVSFPNFNILTSLIKENIFELSNPELSAAFMCLNHLEIGLHESIMNTLHLQILKCIQSMDLTSLTHISFVFRSKGILAFFTQSKIIAKVVPLLDSCASLYDLKNISIILINTKRLVSPDLTQKYYNLLQKSLDNNLLLDCSSSFKILFLKYVHLLSKHNFPMSLCRSLANSLSQDIPKLTPGQIVTLNKTLLKQLEPRNIHFKLQEHTSRIFDDYKDMDVQTDLLLCLISQSNLKTKEYYEKLTLQKIVLLQDHHDIISLSRLIQFMKSIDSDLCKKLWNQTMLNVKQNYLFHPYMNLNFGDRERVLFFIYGNYILLNCHVGGIYRCKEIEEEIICLIKEELNDSSRFFPTKIAHLAAFLLAFSGENELPNEFYEKLCSNSAQYNIYDINFLSKGIKCFFYANDKNKVNKKMIAKVCKLLDDLTEPILMNCTSLAQVSALTKAFLFRQSSPASPLFDILTHNHLRFIDQLNSCTISIITNNFKETCYVDPQINEAISNYVIKNEESMFPRIIYKILSYFYAIGFHPLKCTEFTNSSKRILEMTCEKMDCHLVLESCLALCFYKNLSTELIHYVFNIKFLEQLEEEIYSTFSKRYSSLLKSLLMQLNRAVCLDFPEEKVPWFHEEYCQQHWVKESIYPMSNFHQEVHDMLTTILGSENIVTVNRKSPYYYNLDLEFALDRNGKPVSVHGRNLRSSKSSLKQPNNIDHKSVTVQVRDENCYTLNDQTLTGYYKMERRHLEILGFAVVEVPFSNWYSMSMTAKEDKIKFLKNQIYKELSRIT